MDLKAVHHIYSTSEGLREQLQQQDRRRNAEDRALYNKMRVFMQLWSKAEHEKFLQGLIDERNVRRKIEELKEYRRQGVRTLAETKLYNIDKKRREAEIAARKARESAPHLYSERSNSRGSKWASAAVEDKDKSRSRRASAFDISTSPDVELLSAQEQQLCIAIRIYPKQYLTIKEILLKEFVRVGHLKKSAARRLVKIDVNKTSRIFDFLEMSKWINSNPS